MASKIYVNISWGNGLMPLGIKPLPQPMLMYSKLDLKEQMQWNFVEISDIFIK